ncbi:DUF3021 domain-containing protein [Sporolactobacillus putidus]|uniref:DUF3021 domain-containing protein n=1 Tax=Sporolactobacillus putidus TaxID=492735 RepID=A0A917RZV0_9BACL|nr:DUF3021 domain-containing protein [Sporolactobacillus putidus]GGL45500.1 hypothetical protein GCM10007968_07020 [Sporolactobacillus putidus]
MWISKLINRIMIGFGIGALATVVYLMIAMHFQLPVLSTGLMMKELLGSMAFGAYCCVTSFIYNWEKINPSAQTAIHFPLMLIGFFIAGTLLGWLTYFPFWSFFWFFFIYLMLWLYFYLYNRNMAKRLNEGLKKE